MDEPIAQIQWDDLIIIIITTNKWGWWVKREHHSYAKFVLIETEETKKGLSLFRNVMEKEANSIYITKNNNVSHKT